MTGGERAKGLEHALGDHLRAHGYHVETMPIGLVVRSVARPADEARSGRGLYVTCRPRTDDGCLLWFFGGGEPLAPADQPMNAVTALKARLP